MDSQIAPQAPLPPPLFVSCVLEQCAFGPISLLPWVPAASGTELPLVTRRESNKTPCTRTVCLDEDRQAWGGTKKVFPPPCPIGRDGFRP